MPSMMSPQRGTDFVARILLIPLDPKKVSMIITVVIVIVVSLTGKDPITNLTRQKKGRFLSWQSFKS